MLKKLSLSAAAAALMVSGALAQSTTPTDQTKPAAPVTPPAATAPAPAPTPDTTAATTTSTTTKTETVNFKSAMDQNESLASKITGMAVRNAAGDSLGDINDIVMDDSGKATIAIIGVGGFLGIGEKDVGVPFSALTFAKAQDGTRVARLDVTKDALKAAPAFVYKDNTGAAGKS